MSQQETLFLFFFVISDLKLKIIREQKSSLLTVTVCVTSILKVVFSNFIIVITFQTCSSYNAHLFNRVRTFWKKWFAIPPHPIFFKPPHHILNRLNWINGSFEVVFCECSLLPTLNTLFHASGYSENLRWRW